MMMTHHWEEWELEITQHNQHSRSCVNISVFLQILEVQQHHQDRLTL